MKKENSNKVNQKEESRWIDIHNDKVVNEMGLMRPLSQEPRDNSVWSKTPNERRILKNVKYQGSRSNMHFGTVPTKRSTVVAKLIIYLKPNKTFPKSTYSFSCTDTSVNSILSKFVVTNPKSKQFESVINKYSYNGRIYS